VLYYTEHKQSITVKNNSLIFVFSVTRFGSTNHHRARLNKKR